MASRPGRERRPSRSGCRRVHRLAVPVVVAVLGREPRGRTRRGHRTGGPGRAAQRVGAITRGTRAVRAARRGPPASARPPPAGRASIRLGVAAGVAHPCARRDDARRAGRRRRRRDLRGRARTGRCSGSRSQLDRTRPAPVRAELPTDRRPAGHRRRRIAAAPGTGAIGRARRHRDHRQRSRSGPVRRLRRRCELDRLRPHRRALVRADRARRSPRRTSSRQTGLHLGDTVQLSNDGRAVTVRLVGEIFDQADRARSTISSFAATSPISRPWTRAQDRRAGRSARHQRRRRWPMPDALEQATDSAVSLARSMPRTSTRDSSSSCRSSPSWGSCSSRSRSVACSTRSCSRRGSGPARCAVLKALGISPRQVIVMVVAIGPAGRRGGRSDRRPARARVPARGADVHGPGGRGDAHPRAHVRRVRPRGCCSASRLSGLAIAAIGAYLPALRAARARSRPVLQAE